MSKYFFISLIILLTALVSCERDVSVSEPIDYEVGTAEYYISTYPPGAAIFIDDRNTGLFTPDTLKWLAEGTHDFVIKMEPYLDYQFTDDVENDKVNSKIYSFYDDPKNFGSIKFNSDPDSCDIYLNDSLLTSKTPHVRFNLLPAKYKVKYSYPGHRSDSTSVFVYAGKQSFVSMELPDTSIWVTYNVENSYITENTINDIVVDDNNTLWIGTWHNGIIKVSNGKKEFLTTENSNLPNDIINRIKIAPNGSIWIGTYVGLAFINNGIINSYRTTNSDLPSNYIADFDFDASGNIWVGTQGGLAKFDGNSWDTYTTANSSIPGNFVTAVYIDENDSVWVGTSQFNTSKFVNRDIWVTYQADSSLIGDSVADLIVANDNNLWIGLVAQPTKFKEGGIFILENNQLTERVFNLANKRINRFFMDDENILWIGTRAGVVAVNPSGSYTLYTANITGLPINDILSIAKDKDGNMWFGTNGRGLVKYKIWNE